MNAPPPPSALQRAVPLLLTALHAALFIAATVIVFIPHARETPWLTVFQVFWYATLGWTTWRTWRDWRAGLLSMPLSQLHRQIAAGNVRRTSLLELSAMLMGIAATTILT